MTWASLRRPSGINTNTDSSEILQMPETYLDLVRFRNDGEDFHILWTARRALRLLVPSTGLVAVVVEGISELDTLHGKRITAGLLVADTVEYFSGETFDGATRIVVSQLKYSTTAPHKPWTLSGLKPTLAAFVKRYRTLASKYGAAEVASKQEFQFVTNRPISKDLSRSLEVIAGRLEESQLSRAGRLVLEQLRRSLRLPKDTLQAFARTLHINAEHPPRADLARQLSQEATSYAANLTAAPTSALKELVRSKATSDGKVKPAIRRETVLEAFGFDDPRQLFPAPPRFERVDARIRREQEADIVAAVSAAVRPVLVEAPGGVGKSAFAQILPDLMPKGSEAVVFDGFAGGTYRAPSEPRHRHETGLVHIANSLAVRGLCDPLLPTYAPPHEYIRAFRRRLAQAASVVRSRSSEAVVLIVLDAADNSQLAANAVNERCFVSDLLQEAPPEGCRLVAFLRPERISLLKPPDDLLSIRLNAYSIEETRCIVKDAFADATDEQIAEFHRLTFANPRVQANQLRGVPSLAAAIQRLGPGGYSVEDLIVAQLAASLTDLRRAQPETSIDTMCQALAVLPPLIPIDVVARVSGIASDAIRSFASDFGGGRPLLIYGDAVQFRDEPVETWFQRTFMPDEAAAAVFAGRLRSVATTNAYAAQAMPQLLQLAGRYEELLDLALSAQVDIENPVEKRFVFVQRIQFALKASLGRQRLSDVAKLLIRAGEEESADERQADYLAKNSDLVARLAGGQVVDDFVFRRRAGQGAWFGSANAYNAAMLAADTLKLGEARTYVRLAESWLREWATLPENERREQPLQASDLAALAFALARCEGPTAATVFLNRVQPFRFAFEVALRACEMLIDSGEVGTARALLREGKGRAFLRAACVHALVTRGHAVTKDEVTHAITPLSPTKLSALDEVSEQVPIIAAIATLAEAAASNGLVDLARKVLAKADPIVPHAPFPDLGGRLSTALRFVALKCVIDNEAKTAKDLWRSNESRVTDEDPPSREFTLAVEVLLPWYLLRAKALAGQVADIDGELHTALAPTGAMYSFSGDYREHELRRLRLRAAVESLVFCRSATPKRVDAVITKSLGDEGRLGFDDCLFLVHLLGRDPKHGKQALAYAKEAAQFVESEHGNAASKASEFSEIARAVLPISASEAAIYFRLGVEAVDRVGDEMHDRLFMLLGMAEAAGNSLSATAEDAYRLLQICEVFHGINDHKFPWTDVVEAVVALHPASGFAVFSRLEDRHVVRIEQSLPALLESLLERNLLPIEICVSLHVYGGYWPYKVLADRLRLIDLGTLRSVLTDLECDIIDQRTESYNLSRLVDAIRERGELSPYLDAVFNHQRKIDERRNSGGAFNGRIEVEPEPETDWVSFLSSRDLTSPEDLVACSEAYGGKFDLRGQMYAAMRELVPVDRWPSHVSALTRATELHLWEVVPALEGAASDWHASVAVQAALKSGVIELVRNRALELASKSYLWKDELPKLAKLAKVPVGDLFRLILINVAPAADQLPSGALLSLARVVTERLLDPSLALDTLRFALNRTLPMLRAEDGDGFWNEALRPADSVEDAVSGLLWNLLGSPEPPTRWRAAHAVRRLCKFGQVNVINSLVRRAERKDIGPFHDADLPFYDDDARLFLLIALARAAMESPASLGVGVEWLRTESKRGNSHVFCRYFAAEALLALLSRGLIELSEVERQELNGSLAPAHGYSSQTDSGYGHLRSQRRPDDRFLLPYDFEKEWLAPLARSFGLDTSDVEERVVSLLVDEWKITSGGGWKTDPRAVRNFYRYRRARGAGEIDTLNFHQASHATAVVAGRLLEERPVAANGEDWRDWLRGRILTRPDGQWLADRRDSIPVSRRSWIVSGRHDRDWQWDVQASDFDFFLWTPAGRLVLWGDWNETDHYREETIYVESAFVSNDKADDFLRASQLSKRPITLPLDRYGMEIRQPGYRLTALAGARERQHGLDRQDPLSGDIRYPALEPSRAVCRRFSIESDPDGRTWLGRGEWSKLRFYSTVWGEPSRHDSDKSRHGYQLSTDLAAIADILRTLGRALVVTVRIRRKDSSSSEREFSYVEPYSKIFGFLDVSNGIEEIG